jgi:hypothetical protein
MIYRVAPTELRFVCLSCETRAPVAGLCPGCFVERLPLSDVRVRDELAAAAERRLHARAGREQRLAGVAAFLAASPLGWIGWPLGVLAWFAAGLAGTTLLWQIAARCPGTALQVFRRRRLIY